MEGSGNTSSLSSSQRCKLNTTITLVGLSMFFTIVCLLLDDWFYQSDSDDENDTYWSGGLLGLSGKNDDSYKKTADDVKEFRNLFSEGTEYYEKYDELYNLFLRLHSLGVSIAVLEGFGLLVLLAELVLVLVVSLTRQEQLYKPALFIALVVFRGLLSIPLVFCMFLIPPVSTSCDNAEEENSVVCVSDGPVMYVITTIFVLASQGLILWLLPDIKNAVEWTSARTGPTQDEKPK